MNELANLLIEAKKTKRRYDEVLGYSNDVPQNQLAYDLAEHIEKQIEYEGELTLRITELEQEVVQLRQRVKHLSRD